MTNYLHFIKAYPFYFVGAMLTIFPLILMWKNRVYEQRPFFFLFIFLIYKLVNDLVMIHFASFQVNNLFFSNVNVVVRYFLLCCMYYHLFSNPRYKKILVYVSAAFILLATVEIYRSLGNFDTAQDNSDLQYSSTIECIAMISWILLYYYEIIKSLKISNLLASPSFLISAGFLMFYAVFAFVAPVMMYVNRWEPTVDIGFIQYIPAIFEMGYTLIVFLSFWNYPQHADGSR